MKAVARMAGGACAVNARPSAPVAARALPVPAGARAGFAPRVRGLHTASKRSFIATAAAEATSAGPVTDGTFEELVLKSKVPVLVDFWAPWCGPCRMIAPLIDELAEEYGAKLKCLKLNTDESPSVATEYGIRSIPTVMVFKGGQKLDTVIGAVPKSTLTNIINKYID